MSATRGSIILIPLCDNMMILSFATINVQVYIQEEDTGVSVTIEQQLAYNVWFASTVSRAGQRPNGHLTQLI